MKKQKRPRTVFQGNDVVARDKVGRAHGVTAKQGVELWGMRISSCRHTRDDAKPRVTIEQEESHKKYIPQIYQASHRQMSPSCLGGITRNRDEPEATLIEYPAQIPRLFGKKVQVLSDCQFGGPYRVNTVMTDDAELLRRYVETHSEPDFTALVERYLNVVYQSALRQCDGRSDLAQDAAQQVFTTLVREAPNLINHPTLAGWLFTTTRHASSHIRRTEQRRQSRETEAFMRSSFEDSVPEADWEQIRGQLDEVMDKLSEQDRTAIILRYFQNLAFAKIGYALDLNEDSARKRVERALERLRLLLAKRGVTSTAAMLGALLTSQAANAAPNGLVQTISAAALVPGATASLPASGLIYFMNTKLALGTAGTLSLAALLSIPISGLALYERHQDTKAKNKFTLVQEENTSRMEALNDLQNQIRAVELKVSHLKDELARARPPLADLSKKQASTRSKAEAEALSDGLLFLTRFPESRQMLVNLGRAQIHAHYLGFYRSANLTEAQIEELENRTNEYSLKSLVITPNSISSLENQLPDEQALQILGQEKFQHFQNFNRVQRAYWLAGYVQMAVGYTTTPLSEEQSTQLVQAIADGSSAYLNGQTLKVENVDWSTTLARAQSILTPEQWKAAQPAFLSAQLQAAIERAQQEPDSFENPKS